MTRFQSFSLSTDETVGVELLEEDIFVGMEEVSRSLVGKIVGEKIVNIVGVRSTMMKLWGNRVPCKVLALDKNVY